MAQAINELTPEHKAVIAYAPLKACPTGYGEILGCSEGRHESVHYARKN